MFLFDLGGESVVLAALLLIHQRIKDAAIRRMSERKFVWISRLLDKEQPAGVDQNIQDLLHVEV